MPAAVLLDHIQVSSQHSDGARRYPVAAIEAAAPKGL
jgi:hypothetical protein